MLNLEETFRAAIGSAVFRITGASSLGISAVTAGLGSDFGSSGVERALLRSGAKIRYFFFYPRFRRQLKTKAALKRFLPSALGSSSFYN